MKTILTICLLILSINLQAQHKYRPNTDDRSGIVLSGIGVLSMSIGILVPDGSEYTYNGKYLQNRVNKPFYKNPSRDCCIVIGLTLTISGLNYQKHQH